MYLNLPYYSNLTRFEASRPAFTNDPVTFLYSGSLSHRKGVDLLARAFLRLAAAHPHVRLKLMGEGRMEPRLRRELASCDRVEWVGFKDWDELPAVYASAQFLCVPSRHDGWGLVVPEGTRLRFADDRHQPHGRRDRFDRDAPKRLAGDAPRMRTRCIARWRRRRRSARPTGAR